MSKSLLYHGFGLKDIEHIKTEYQGGSIIFHIRTTEAFLSCSGCGSKEVIKKGSVQRKFRTVPIGLKPVYIVGHIQRLECKTCGVIRQEKIKYADKKKLIPVD